MILFGHSQNSSGLSCGRYCIRIALALTITLSLNRSNVKDSNVIALKTVKLVLDSKVNDSNVKTEPVIGTGEPVNMLFRVRVNWAYDCFNVNIIFLGD